MEWEVRGERREGGRGKVRRSIVRVLVGREEGGSSIFSRSVIEDTI